MMRFRLRWWLLCGSVFAIVSLLLLFPALQARTTGDDQAVTPEASDPKRQPSADPDRTATGHGLPAPHTVSVPQFEGLLFPFLQERRYVDLGWTQDKSLRDTGPYIDGVYYGTHPAVRVFYSPEIIHWLEAGRRGTIPDGAMIVKEQYPPPAIRHEGKSEAELWEALESWTVMIKDAAGSHDGWFWSNPAKGQEVVDNHADFSHPISGFGLYCIRCHASTQSPDEKPDSPGNEFTFASLRNVAGYPGEPLIFRVDDSWRQEDTGQETELPAAETDVGQARKKKESGSHPACIRSGTVTICTATPHAEFESFFNTIRPVRLKEVSKLPPVTHDHVARRRSEAQEFVTSNQCMSCHAGLMKPFGPTMVVPTGEGQEYGDDIWNISPYGEWRWTPMGLAGRDPIFLAQLEAERTLLEDEFGANPRRASRMTALLEDTCLKCHGAMGRHQFHCDGDDSDTFSLEMCEEIAKERQHIGHGDSQYGALAREGISCMVCHRMQERPQPADDKRPYLQFFLETSVTGNLHFGPQNEVYGPYKDDEITAYPMQHALGITPKHSTFLQSSRHCGSCHTVTLPAVDTPLSPTEFDELNDAQVVQEFAGFHHHVEQATYLEWLNSEFENEFDPDNPKAKSCQDCHMSRTLVDEKHGIQLDTLETRMAIIQDTTYPDAENLASHKDLTVRVREKGYSRHDFSGLNLFLLELFDQFDDVLGVRTQDYMTGSKVDIEHARQSFLQTAREKTADLTLKTDVSSPGELRAEVTVTNKAGHRFPTGVGFRRAFIELLVVEKTSPIAARANKPRAERILWSSGRTNSLGIIVDADDRPLPTEFFEQNADGSQAYQSHHEEITDSAQVQIYESLLRNADEQFTTSFLHGCSTLKDNRLLPRGWSKDGPDDSVLTGRYLAATHPQGRATTDADYQDGRGSDQVTYRIPLPESVDPQDVEVRATLYYQAIPPYFLRNLFETAPQGEATRRLYFLLSHLDLEKTALKGWKLAIATATAQITDSPVE